MEASNKALIMKAQGLLDQAGATYKIWTDEDVRDIIRSLRRANEVSVPDDDEEIVALTDLGYLAEITEADWMELVDATTQAIEFINEQTEDTE